MRMNKRDFVAIALVVALSLVGFLLFGRTGEKGKEVVIRSDGRLVGTYPLSENRELTVTLGSGKNTIVIRDGGVSVSDADCPDKYCVKQGVISRSGESLICLPHRLAVEITDGSEPDGTAR